MTFQKTLNRDPAAAVAGDFASINPRQNMLAKGGDALRTSDVITCGQFAFADLTTGLVYSETAAGRVPGFVHRTAQGAVPLGQDSTFVYPIGREIALFAGGDFFAVAPADVAPNDAVNIDANGELVETGTATKFFYATAAATAELVKITRDAI